MNANAMTPSQLRALADRKEAEEAHRNQISPKRGTLKHDLYELGPIQDIFDNWCEESVTGADSEEAFVTMESIEKLVSLIKRRLPSLYEGEMFLIDQDYTDELWVRSGHPHELEYTPEWARDNLIQESE